MLRPELVKNYPTPLSPDAFSSFQEEDPNAPKHNQEVTEAYNFLLKEVIPKFAKDIENRDPIKFDIASELHSVGINIRLLNHVRELVNNNEWKHVLLAEFEKLFLFVFVKKNRF